MDARHAGLALLLAGLGALWIVGQAFPSPASWEQWICCDGPPSHVFAARGPAVARYDAAADATDVVFRCSHAWCATAAHVRGNLTGRGSAEHVLLWTGSWPPHRDARAIEPIPVASSFSPTASVNGTTELTFEEIPLTPVVATHVAAWSAFLAGVAVAARGSWWEGAACGLTGAAVMIVLSLAEPFGEGSVLLEALGLLGLVVALVVALAAWRSSSARRVALVLAIAAAAILASAWDIAPFFPAGPAL